MKIKTRLEISAIFFICMVIAVGLTLSFFTQQVNEAYEMHSDVDKIVERTFTLNLLTGDFMVHQEERVITQWLNVHDSLSNHLAALEIQNNEEQILLDEIRHTHEEIDEVFSQLVTIYEEQDSSGEGSDLRDITIAQLSVGLSDMVSKASLLSEACQERYMRTYQQASVLVIVFVIVIAAGIGVNSFLIITTIGKPIADLHHGVEMIRSGNLNHKVGILAKDEIGQLSRDFDEMTEELRVRSEELNESEKKFRLFFENAPEYCYMISPEGNIIDINNTALAALEYTKEEMIGKPALTTIYAPSSRKKAKRLLAEWRKTGEITNQELTIVSKKGEERQVLLSVQSVRDSEGEIIHSISVQ
ncbi:MAG: PAS domain S-box protein, partial [Candidatus Bathyarchaeia archaeon]